MVSLAVLKVAGVGPFWTPMPSDHDDQDERETVRQNVSSALPKTVAGGF